MRVTTDCPRAKTSSSPSSSSSSSPTSDRVLTHQQPTRVRSEFPYHRTDRHGHLLRLRCLSLFDYRYRLRIKIKSFANSLSHFVIVNSSLSFFFYFSFILRRTESIGVIVLRVNRVNIVLYNIKIICACIYYYLLGWFQVDLNLFSFLEKKKKKVFH